MIGICSYSGYVPRYRINRMTIYSAMGWMNPAIIMNAAGEKPVASFDEDSITMAVAAGRRCLEGFNPSRLEALYFATTTAPYKERQNANIIAGALCAPKEIRSADFGGSLKAGTNALLSALELVAAGGGKLAAAEPFAGGAAGEKCTSGTDPQPGWHPCSKCMQHLYTRA